MISTTLNPTQSIWNSLLPFLQTISTFFLWQSVWKVVYAVQIQRTEYRKLLMNGQHPLCFLAEAIPGLIYIKYISKKHFRLGGLTASEWTRSVRAIRDTPVADYSVPGVNTTHRVAYRPPIAVSPFLLALSVSYFKQTLWSCGQL
jgi:hypothetical protein